MMTQYDATVGVIADNLINIGRILALQAAEG